MTVEIDRIGRALLPRDLNKDIMTLTSKTSVRALSYRILCHAQIEHYIEDRVVEIATATHDAWNKRGYTSRSTFCLLAFSGMTLTRLPETLKPPPKRKQADWGDFISPNKRLLKSISSYVYEVRHLNHGIKEPNLISMLLPIGYDPKKIDEVMITELNDFGSKRGAAAHGSISGHVSAGINPKDEATQVSRILFLLRSVDEELTNIKRTAR